MIVKMDKVKVQDRYSNKYKALLADLGKLTADTAVLYPIPKGTPWQKMYDRIASILDYRKLKAPKGFMFSRAMSADGRNVVITLHKRGGKRAPAKNVKKVHKKIRKLLKGKVKAKSLGKFTTLKPSAVKAADKMASDVRAKADKKKSLKAARDARYRAKKKAATPNPPNSDSPVIVFA